MRSLRAGSRIRTDDLLITNQLLYQLSYAGIYLGKRHPDGAIPNVEVSLYHDFRHPAEANFADKCRRPARGASRESGLLWRPDQRRLNWRRQPDKYHEPVASRVRLDRIGQPVVAQPHIAGWINGHACVSDQSVNHVEDSARICLPHRNFVVKAGESIIVLRLAPNQSCIKRAKSGERVRHGGRSSCHSQGSISPRDESPMLHSPEDSFFGLTNLSRSSCLKYSMGRTRRWRESDENYDAITTRVGRDVDVEIGLPVVNGPNVAGLIDHHARLTHHRDEAWLSA